MGKEKHLSRIRNLFQQSPVVSFSTIARAVKAKKKKSQYAKQLVKNLVLKGEIFPLAKGYYTSRQDNSLAVFCFKPAYLGLQDALSFYGFWEQETIPVIITARRVRQGVRQILGGNVLVRRIDKKYLFGFDYLQSGEAYLPYSDKEKTLIDMLYFKEKIDARRLRQIVPQLKPIHLKKYLSRYPSRFRKKAEKTVFSSRKKKHL